LFCGSAAVGFLGGYLLTRPRRAPRDRRWPNMTERPGFFPTHAWSGRPEGLPPPQIGTQPLEERKEEGPGWIDTVAHKLEPALSQLKEVAIGAAISMIGKMLLEKAPPALRGDLSGVVEKITNAFGGKPVDIEMPAREPEAQPEGEKSPRHHNRLSGTKSRGNGRSAEN